jgi:hypothetical protein
MMGGQLPRGRDATVIGPWRSCSADLLPGSVCFVIHPRHGHLDRACAGYHLPRLVVTVAYHQASALVSTLPGEASDIRRPPQLAEPRRASLQASSRTISIRQRRRAAAASRSFQSSSRTKVSMGLHLLVRRANVGLA